MIKQLLNKLPRKPSAKPPTSHPLPLLHLRDAPDAPALFLRKLSLSTTPSDPAADNELKRHTLLELIDYISSSPGKFSDTELQAAIFMVSTNLFRPLPAPSPTPAPLDPAEEPPPPADPAWPHLQLVYEFLLRLIVSPDTDAKLAKRYLHHPFLLRLLDLFNSEDHRERDYLKTILHRIYGKFMLHRPFIRKAINNIFYTFIFETESHNGIAELLEVLGSIINGFAMPLKEEHKLFLMRVLLPLHKPRCVSFYYQQLCFCVVQFVEKDSKLADSVIRGLLKCWPVTDSGKEVMFIGEVEQILEVTQVEEFERCMVPLFRQIGRCISSSSFQVAERALYLWNNDTVRNLITQNKEVILPIVFPALERTTRGHWNQSVQTLTLNVRQLFLDADRDLSEECILRFHEEAAKERAVQEKRDLTWKRLEEVAASRAVSKEAVLISRVVSFKTISSPQAAVGT